MKLNGVELRSDFGDPLGEARACRNACALFDFSFIRCARIEGKQARQAVENFSSRSLTALREGRVFYAVRADTDGNAVSDLTIWKTGADSFEVMSGRSEDVAVLLENSGNLKAADISEERAVLAVQGPLALSALRQLGVSPGLENLDYFSFAQMDLGNIPCRIGRLGYTGEAGFEIVAARRDLPRLWKMLAPHARPAGFIAADALRIEAGFVLFANEFLLPVSPREAGLGKFHAGPEKSKPELKLVTFQAEIGEIRPLPWQPPGNLRRPSTVGEIVVTSACRGVSGPKITGLGYVRITTPPDMELTDPGGVFRGISQVHTPFYDRQKRRPRAIWLCAAGE